MCHNYATIKAKGDEKMPKIIPIRELRDTNAISDVYKRQILCFSIYYIICSKFVAIWNDLWI